jgi:hypothetical protein
MKEPVDHIERPRLPWRGPNESSVTECGINAVKVKTLTRSEFFRRLKEYGEQRTALLTCMTCSYTAKRWSTWDEEPRDAIQREIEWEGPAYRRGKHGNQLRDELRAIALLIQHHQDEFASLLNHVRNTINFRDEVEKRRGMKKTT